MIWNKTSGSESVKTNYNCTLSGEQLYFIKDQRHWKWVSTIPGKSVSFHFFKLSGIEKNFAKKYLRVKFLPTETSETNVSLVGKYP